MTIDLHEESPPPTGWTRRRFLAATGAAAAAAHAVQSVATAQAPASGAVEAIQFPRSFLYCAPGKSGIWVRVQMECRAQVTDVASGKSDEYVLGVMAKTGVSADPKTGKPGPGYDYSIIFSKDHVFTKRSHSSAYLNNPTVLTHEQFGLTKWHLQRVPAEPVRTAAEVRSALEGWRELSARTTFTSDDGAREVTIEYPVKWADFNLDNSGFRVETGPVFLLDPNQVAAGTLPQFSDFRWAHLDYHGLDKVRCLIERPTSILADATFTPPKEDGREVRETSGLSAAQIKRLREAIHENADGQLSAAALDLLLSTDHYSLAKEFDVRTEILALRS